MQRNRRRWWTWGLSIAASLVVLAATLSLLFRLAVDAVPGYRDKLQSLVTETAGHPTRIGAMALTWQRLRPSLDLRDVALLDPQGKPLLQVARLRLGFGLWRLFHADWTPGIVEVYGLQLEADVDALGHWSLRGFGGGSSDPDAMRRLSLLDRVGLRDCSLVVHDPQLSRLPLTVGLVRAELRRSGNRYSLSARLLPPPDLAAAAIATAALEGEPGDTHSWHGSWSLQVNQIQGWPWLAGSLGQGVQLSLAQAQLHLGGRIDGGRIAEVDAQGSAATVAAVRGKDTLAQLSRLQVEIAALPEPDAWRTEVRKLALNGVRGPVLAQGRFRYAVNAQGTALDASADGLRLDELGPWAALWKDLPVGAARLRDIRGDVHDLALHYEQGAEAAAPPRYSLRARLAGAGLAADPAQPGFSGLDANVEADQDGGRVSLRQAAFQVQLPEVFEQALPVSALGGDFAWKHEAPVKNLGGGWRIGAEAFDWKVLGTSGHGKFSLLLPDLAEVSPNLQLSADFAAEDIVALKPYTVKNWGPGTRDWLNRALLHGRVAQGHLQLDGPLADYPYVEQPDGHWILDIGVADATLAFAPGWPSAEKLQAQLAFRGHGLAITSSGAQIAGNGVDHIEAQIPDFRKAYLSIDGNTHSDAAKYYALMRNSPLNKRLGALLGQTDATGPAAVGLHLEIPLDVADPPVHVRGTARVDGLSVKVRALDQSVTAVRGTLAFDDDGVTSEGLSAQLYGSALAATIVREKDSPDGVLLVQTEAPVETTDGLFAAYVPDWLRSRMSGSMHLAARLPFAGPHSGELSLSSDLRGVAARLPVPVGKAAEDSLPLAATIGGGSGGKADSDALRVMIDAGERFAVDLRFARGGKPPAETMSTRGVAVRLGPGALPRADADGIVVSGAPAELDLEGAIALIDTIGDGKPAIADSIAFRGSDLRPQRLLYHGAVIEQAHVAGAPAADGWNVLVDGPNAQGRVDYSRAGGGHVLARFERLHLQPLASLPQAPAGQEPEAGPPFDPNQAPLFDLACDSLKLGAADLGRFSLRTSRTAGGQSLDQLKLEGGQLQTSTRGSWLRRNGSSYADLSFEIDSSDLGTVLQSFGYAETMDGKKARISGTLTWPQDPQGLDLAQARGSVALAVEKGALKAVKPGATRVLGLFNLYALPRRLLTLDFHDVVSTGLAFDTLSGYFELADGQARTSDLKIESPSMKMQMNGRIGLAARDYDEKNTVYPNVTTGVTVGATLIGGPIAGGIALLAQEIFNKPFNTLSRFSYHVTGGWDNPQVKGGDNKELTKELPRAAPPASDAAPAPEPEPPAAPAADAG
jgi:uncharacterized protein (TIGR02099 family)